MANSSPIINLRSREVDPRIKTSSSSVPPTSKYIFSEDGKRFPDTAEGAERHASHQHFLAVCKRSGISSPPPSQKNLFGDPSGSEAEHDLGADEVKRLQHDLSLMTNELESSRVLMDLKFAELQSREEALQRTIQDSVQKALEDYIANNPNPPNAPAPTPVPSPSPVASVPMMDLLPIHNSNSAIQMICGSVNILDRLMSRFKLPDIFKDERHEVATAIDLYYRSLKKYDKLSDVFSDAFEGADLIMAVQRFRDLFFALKGNMGPELLDWLTLYALSSQSDVLHDKVQAALIVACSVKFNDRQVLFNDMMSSGVLPEAMDHPSDIMNSIGALELFSANSSAIALKSVCNFVVSYCGYFEDILSKAQDAERDYLRKKYEATDDCQARFSAELREHNTVMVWFGADFMIPFKRARLFLEKCPMHIKKQYAEDSELLVGMSWQQFKTKMALAWSTAVKKRRMMIDIGLDVEAIPAVPEYLPPAYPSISPDPATPPPPVPSFTSGVDDVMIEIQCKEEGCGLFPYSVEKIQWLRDKFMDKFKMPSRCVKHKAIEDAKRAGSPPENPVPISGPPFNPDSPLKNRFGSRRTPNATVP